MFSKCIWKITFIKWDSDKYLNLGAAQQTSTGRGIGRSPLKLSVSHNNLVWGQGLPVPILVIFCHFPWH